RTGCIKRIVYRLDELEFASAERPPYDVTIDPAQLTAKFPSLSSNKHVLSVIVENSGGKKELQSDRVLLSFDAEKRPNIVDVQALAQSLASQLSQRSGYIFDPEFAEQIRSRTDEYRIDLIDDARRYRREIIKAFRDKGLPPLLGFVLAM